jgi:hypothetical protein
MTGTPGLGRGGAELVALEERSGVAGDGKLTPLDLRKNRDKMDRNVREI